MSWQELLPYRTTHTSMFRAHLSAGELTQLRRIWRSGMQGEHRPQLRLHEPRLPSGCTSATIPTRESWTA